MTVDEPTVTPHYLAALFEENSTGIDKEVLTAIAEETIQNYPGFASFLARVITSDNSNPGRATAMKTLGKNLYKITITSNSHWNRDELGVQRDLSTIRENAARWWRIPERTDLIRDWALVNAAQELGVDVETLIGPDQVIYCARFHERHLFPLLTGDSWFSNGWSDEFYTDEYWRGLATLSVIAEWCDEKESYAFVQWAGKQENIRAIAEEGHKRRTIDIEALSEATGLGALGPAISRGAL